MANIVECFSDRDARSVLSTDDYTRNPFESNRFEEWTRQLRGKLEPLLRLGDNWDSYGAASIGDDAIESTAILLLQMSQQLMMDQFDPFIVPTVDGGIGVDFEESNISITVSADGQSFEITGSDDHDSPTLSSISDVSSVVTRMIDGDPALDN